MSIKYSVVVEHFAERHFIKKFKKKYKSAWEVTQRAIVEELRRVDFLFDKSIAEVIIKNEDIRIAKIEFRVAGTDQSRKGSGNRCIIAIHNNSNTVNILLVYHKSDLGDGNETNKWKKIIKDNYVEYMDSI